MRCEKKVPSFQQRSNKRKVIYILQEFSSLNSKKATYVPIFGAASSSCHLKKEIPKENV